MKHQVFNKTRLATKRPQLQISSKDKKLIEGSGKTQTIILKHFTFQFGNK